MNNTGFVEESTKEKNIVEADAKAFETFVCQANKGTDNLCKCGSFLIPLCVVI